MFAVSRNAAASGKITEYEGYIPAVAPKAHLTISK